MTLNLDVLQAEAAYEPYPYELDGQTHELPHIQTLTTEQALRIESGAAKDVITELVGADRAARLMQLPAFAMNALLEGWLAHAGLASGESEASTGS